MITKYVYRVDMIRGLLTSMQAAPGTFVPTGSRVYGGATEQSDYDFIVNPKCMWHDSEWFTQMLNLANYGYTPVREFSAYAQTAEDREYDPELPGAPCGMDRSVVYIQSARRYVDVTINLIFCDSQEEFEAWVKATELLKSTKGTLKRLIETDKQCRIAAFKTAMLAFWKGGAK